MNSFEKIFFVLVPMAFLLSIASCKKDNATSDCGDDIGPHHDTTFTVSGRVYKNCSMEPAASETVEFEIKDSYGYSHFAYTVTDSLGNFNITGDDPCALTGIGGSIYGYLRFEEDSFTFHFNPIGNYVNLNIILYDTFYVKVSLDVQNPYSSNDTFYYRVNSSDSWYYFRVGPFSSGVIDTIQCIPNYLIQDPYGYQVAFWSGIGMQQFQQGITSVIDPTVAPCDGDTTLTIQVL